MAAHRRLHRKLVAEQARDGVGEAGKEGKEHHADDAHGRQHLEDVEVQQAAGGGAALGPGAGVELQGRQPQRLAGAICRRRAGRAAGGALGQDGTLSLGVDFVAWGGLA